MLLSRENDDEFTASFTISAKVAPLVDIGALLKKLLGKLKDNPIAFVPGMKEKTDFDSKVDKLHKVNLLDQCIFLMDEDVPQGGAEEKKEDDGKGEKPKDDKPKSDVPKDDAPEVDSKIENEVDVNMK